METKKSMLGQYAKNTGIILFFIGLGIFFYSLKIFTGFTNIIVTSLIQTIGVCIVVFTIPNTPSKFLIDPSDKFFPEANGWMWSYCTFLGKYVDSDGKQWDLGILLKKNEDDWMSDGNWCAACVYGNEDGNYISGSSKMYERNILNHIAQDKHNDQYDFIKEMIRRAKLLNIIK